MTFSKKKNKNKERFLLTSDQKSDTSASKILYKVDGGEVSTGMIQLREENVMSGGEGERERER